MNSSDKVTGTGRYTCRFDGCHRSFARPEHLNRHAVSHSDDVVFVCPQCQRKFTRSDSLQRHMLRHGDGFKPTSSGRSKRACMVCHASKVKCDGNDTCSRCFKRGVECIYSPHDADSVIDSLAGTDEPSSVSHECDATDEFLPGDGQSKGLEVSSSKMAQLTFDQVVPAAMGRTSALGALEWVLASQIKQDSPQERLLIQDDDSHQLSDSQVKNFTGLYFTYFHHRWNIVHAPTHEADAPNLGLSSMLMVGAWLDGSPDSKAFAIAKHRALMSQISMRLSQVSSNDTFQLSLPAILCQAALTNIIFAMYCGREELLSKAIVMQSTLVAVLREVGLFDADIPYDKPGAFRAFRAMINSQRQRLATNLLKIGSYFQILRLQPALLTPEDLHFSLPSTFSLNNAEGLHVFDIRLLIEPPAREQHTIRDMIQSNDLNAADVVDGLMLVEDIQLGICAVSFSLKSSSNEYLIERLEFWKAMLSRLPFRLPYSINLNREQQMAMRFYYGSEDHTVPGWQAIVSARPKDLFFDSLILYHLLSLHANANVKTLRQQAKDISTDYSAYGIPYQEARQKRESEISDWVTKIECRRALSHSTSILVAFRNLRDLEKRMVDPIVYVAISVSALVVWSICTFGDFRAPGRLKQMLGDQAVIDLTAWDATTSIGAPDKKLETWIEVGEGLVALDAIQLSPCNAGLLVERFHSCLPEGWDVSKSIAPGILQSTADR